MSEQSYVVHANAVHAVPMKMNYADEMEHGNVYHNEMMNQSTSDDTIERTGDLFSQLDHMISAVQLESNALDAMRDKLKELDTLRTQLTVLTKRLLDADQANLTLKGSVIKMQESYADLKRSKVELENSLNPVRQELTRTKDMYNKERMARLSAQQETAQLKEHIMRLEKVNEDLDRECKTVPALQESNEILKSDLMQLRQRYKDDKTQMMSQIHSLEMTAREVEGIKAEVRNHAMRLLDLASAPGGSNTKMNKMMAQQQGMVIDVAEYGQYPDGPRSVESLSGSVHSNHSQISYYNNGVSNGEYDDYNEGSGEMYNKENVRRGGQQQLRGPKGGSKAKEQQMQMQYSQSQSQLQQMQYQQQMRRQQQMEYTQGGEDSFLPRINN